MSKLTLDEAIKHCLEVAEKNETSAITYKNCKEIKANMYEKLTAEKAENDCRECAADHRQLAAWLTELKEWKENPFRRIKAECKENYYCNNCAFIDHCPFSNGNRVAAEYPMDWVIY